MTIEQIKDNIAVEIHDDGGGRFRIEARLSLGATYLIQRDTLQAVRRFTDYIEEQKERLRLHILRELFADQTTELQKAVHDFLSAPPPWRCTPGIPCDPKQEPAYLSGAVLAAARWQPHAGKLEADPKTLGNAWARGAYALDVEVLRNLINSKSARIQKLEMEVRDLRGKLQEKERKEKEVAG